MIRPWSSARLLTGVLLLVACGGRSTQHTERAGSERGGRRADPAAGSSGTAGASTTGGIGGTSGATTGGASGATTGGTSGATTGGTSGTGPGDACVMTTLDLGRYPVNLFVTVDRSEAMREAWPEVTAALVTLFEDPSLSLLAPALKFFPDELSGCNAVTCNAEPCSSPLIPFAELLASSAPADEQEELLVDTLLGTEPVADEAPITVAWRGARDAVAALKAARPEEGAQVLLVTAGEPDTCGGDAAMLASLTAAAVAEAGIATFVATPANTSAREDLDRIALSGGTQKAFLLGPETEDLAYLINELMPVGGGIICDVQLPQFPDGRMLDLERAVVTLTLEADPPIDLPRLSSDDACGDAVGWHYDDDSRPTRIEFCQVLCSTVSNARQALVSVQFPCL